jgi:hypothetical protein
MFQPAIGSLPESVHTARGPAAVVRPPHGFFFVREAGSASPTLDIAPKFSAISPTALGNQGVW